MAIGTHDLDTIEGPFLYTAQSPDEIRFVALNQTETKSAAQLMDMYSVENLSVQNYRVHLHLKNFVERSTILAFKTIFVDYS